MIPKQIAAWIRSYAQHAAEPMYDGGVGDETTEEAQEVLAWLATQATYDPDSDDLPEIVVDRDWLPGYEEMAAEVFAYWKRQWDYVLGYGVVMQMSPTDERLGLVIPPAVVGNWTHYMTLDYSELPEIEKLRHRQEAVRYLNWIAAPGLET